MQISNTNRKMKQNSDKRELKKMKIVEQEKIQKQKKIWNRKNKEMNKQKRNKIKSQGQFCLKISNKKINCLFNEFRKIKCS